jgi:hypothetical protein
MIKLKCLLLLSISTMLAGTAFADPQRTLFTVENRFPRWEQFEVGAEYHQIEYDVGLLPGNVSTSSVYARYGILDNLAVRLDIPYVDIDPDFGSSESGIGDLKVGLQLRTAEEILGFPYFIPHVSFTIPTGDDEKGLGVDGSIITAGMTWGTKMYDWLSFVLDASYKVHPDEDNIFLLASSFVWDVSEQFAILPELRYEYDNDDDSDILIISGGLSYDWNRTIQSAVYVGSSLRGDVDSFFEARLSYSF